MGELMTILGAFCIGMGVGMALIGLGILIWIQVDKIKEELWK